MFKLFFFRFGNLLKRLLSIASLMDRGFNDRLSSRNFIVVIKTKSNGQVVQYALEDGRLNLKGQDHHDPDISLTFCSVAKAIRMVLKPAPQLMIKSFTDAILNDDLKIEFKPESLMWLFETFTKLPHPLKNLSMKRIKSGKSTVA